MDGVLAVPAASALFVGLLAAAEATTRRWTIDPEHSRKLVHACSGVAGAALPIVMSFRAIIVLTTLFVPFMLVSRRVGLFPAVHGVERATFGEVYFPLGVLLVAFVFPDRLLYAFGVLVMGLSDAAASTAGQRWGRRGYRVRAATKTYVGSGAFLATTFLLALVALAVGDDWFALTAVAVALAVAAALTLVEGASAGGVDNVVLPVAGAALLALAL
jgi:dolichol kinase